jgi:TolB-like protein
MKKWFFVMILGLTVVGCAVRSDYYQGQRSLEIGNYDAAISLFQYAIKKSPNDPQIYASLGYAYFKKDDLPKAIQNFEKAKSIDPTYGKAYLYLGMLYEKQGELPKAIREYNSYYKQYPLTPTGQKIKARISVLMRNQIAMEVQDAINKEKEISVDSIPENTIAVYNFANLTGNPELDTLQKGLTDMLITDLAQVSSLRILERTRVQLLMDELKLGETGVIDQDTTPRVGRLLGAKRIISGGFAAPSQDNLRIDSTATNVATSITDAQASVSGNQNGFFTLEKQLVFGILGDLNIPLTQEERDAIQKVPTESFLAFLAYSRGLDYEDRGMYQEAGLEFNKATQLDPNFIRANEKSQEAKVLSETPMTGAPGEVAQLEQSEKQEAPTQTESGLVAVNVLSSMDRLEPIVENIGDGFIPQTGTKTEEQRTPSQVQTTSILNLTIEW